MLINLDATEATVVGEILASALKELRIESARADSHDFRRSLHERERVVEHVLEQVTREAQRDRAPDSPPSRL